MLARFYPLTALRSFSSLAVFRRMESRTAPLSFVGCCAKTGADATLQIKADGGMMPGYLTTHVLDTARGRPAEGMRITLDRLDAGTRERLAETVTNDDGRTDDPILPEGSFATGTYELTFHVGAWLDATGIDGPRFLDEVPIRFSMTEAAHHHVPLLVSPFAYSTYRGS